ncbi:unnamed protein product [Camellia sinensis]
MIKVIELFDVKLSMLGSHQLQNAATATCAFLCLRDQSQKLVGKIQHMIKELKKFVFQVFSFFNICNHS